METVAFGSGGSSVSAQKMPPLGYWAPLTNGNQSMSDTHSQGREVGRKPLKRLHLLPACSG